MSNLFYFWDKQLLNRTYHDGGMIDDNLPCLLVLVPETNIAENPSSLLLSVLLINRFRGYKDGAAWAASSTTRAAPEGAVGGLAGAEPWARYTWTVREKGGTILILGTLGAVLQGVCVPATIVSILYPLHLDLQWGSRAWEKAVPSGFSSGTSGRCLLIILKKNVGIVILKSCFVKVL